SSIVLHLMTYPDLLTRLAGPATHAWSPWNYHDATLCARRSISPGAKTKPSRGRGRSGPLEAAHPVAQAGSHRSLDKIEQRSGERDAQQARGQEGADFSRRPPFGKSQPLPEPAKDDENGEVHHVNRI